LRLASSIGNNPFLLMAIIEDPEQHEAQALARMVPSFAGRKVLEIGCGDGRLTRKYARAAAQVIAIDTDLEDIDQLRRELPFVDARPVGIHDLALPPHSVDVAIFAWSL
jgi:16S rRNA A1518/A1519 N6-dimethyltransferase RsmA/KsgA/DIM1 with predicted DNA glycosylase/AP lyase activity